MHRNRLGRIESVAYDLAGAIGMADAHPGDAMACDASNEIERSAQNVFQVPVLESGTACIQVRSGDTVILPVDLIHPDADPNFRITEADGTLIIKHGEATVFLEGFVATLDDHEINPVVLMEADHTPIDIAFWLAISDPNIDIITGQ
jgi:hypothetical protein